jgi:hypothetical protein
MYVPREGPLKLYHYIGVLIHIRMFVYVCVCDNKRRASETMSSYRCAYTHTCVCPCVSLCKCACIHVRMCAYMHVCVCLSVCMCVPSGGCLAMGL